MHILSKNDNNNIRTAIQSIEDIMPKSTDENLTSELSKEQDEYSCLAKECEAFAKAKKIEGLTKKQNFGQVSICQP